MSKQFILLIEKGVNMFAIINGFICEMMERRDEGQGLVEYALIILLVSIVVIGVLSLLGTSIQDVFQAIIDVFSSYS